MDGLFYKGSGIGRYYESLLKGFATRGITIYTCIPCRFKKSFELDFKQYLKNIIPIYVNYERFSIKAFYSQGKILKKLEKEVSLYHFPHINIPLYAPKNLIVTIHDLRPFTEYWDRNYIKKKIYEWYFKRAIKNAKKLITDSKHIMEEILKGFPEIEFKIKVIYPLIDDKFLDKSNNKNQHKRIVAGDYILFVGSIKKHKNLSQLVIAFNSIKDSFPNLKLVIAGKKDSKVDDIGLLKEKFKIKGRLIEIISPSDEKILYLYKYAKAFVFPSLYEGFGLPPLEAMAYGIPVIVSNIPILKEICGDAAYFVNPHSSENIAQGIYKVLHNNNLKNSLIEKGKKRINDFNSDKLINQYIKVYEETLNARN
jgi:glycosyltransferase involved in cell wall biosynthesis